MSGYSDEYEEEDEDEDPDFDADHSDMTIEIGSEAEDEDDEADSNILNDNSDRDQEEDEMDVAFNPHNDTLDIIEALASTPAATMENTTARTSNDDENAISQTKNGNVATATQAQIDSENCCIICTEMWTNSEEHHVVSLKCGHLFGKKCIETWLAPGRGYNRCPQCNKPAKKRDIHKIFARCVKPLDTWERDEMLAKVKVWEKKVHTLEEELETSKTKCKVLSKENEKLKYDLMTLMQMKSSKSSTSISANIRSTIATRTGPFQITHYKDLDVREGGGRLHCYSKILEALAISVSNPNQHNPLFPKFGIKKVPLGENLKGELVYMHNNLIKDMVVNQYDATISTVSLDKTLKVTSLISKGVIATVTLPVEPWSVHLPTSRPNQLYTGLKNGDVVLYDKRMLNQSILQLKSSAMSPVVSLCTIEYGSNLNNRSSALMSVQLDTCSLFRFDNQVEPENGDYSVIKLPFEGKFASSHFDPKSGYSLLSCRPSQKHEKMTHFLLDFFMDNNQSQMSPDIVNILEGGKEQVQLSRSKVYTHPQNDECVLVCAGDESSKGALLWDGKSSHLQNVSTRQPVLDIEMIVDQHYASSPMISCLSENTVKLYKLT